MFIKEFVEKYKNGEVQNLKETLAIRDYVSFAEKYDLCSSVLAECNTIDNKTGIVTVDSIMRHVVFTISILSLYTNLEFTSDENSEITSIDEYDMLCESKLLRPIIDEFAEEYAECENMLNTMQNDLIANSNTMVNVIGNLAKQLVGVVDSFSDTMKNMNLDQVNIDKITDILETIKQKE